VDPLLRLAQDLGGIPKDLRKKLRPGIKEAAKPVLDRARQNASWSRRIPKATRLSIKFGKRDPSVSITTSAKRAPHARPYEHDGRSGSFRHPVYGNRDVWVTQQARPFLAPAVRAKQDDVVDEIAKVVDSTTRAAGFH
jgi:hypothetical protein